MLIDTVVIYLDHVVIFCANVGRTEQEFQLVRERGILRIEQEGFYGGTFLQVFIQRARLLLKATERGAFQLDHNSES